MLRYDILRTYAEMNNMTIKEAMIWYQKGAITSYELFEAFLNYEGIMGYTQKIVTAFRICWNLDEINDR